VHPLKIFVALFSFFRVWVSIDHWIFRKHTRVCLLFAHVLPESDIVFNLRFYLTQLLGQTMRWKLSWTLVVHLASLLTLRLLLLLLRSSNGNIVVVIDS